jgi:hypothetical protein
MATGEFCQLIGLYAGTFDPRDILAYLAGAVCGGLVEIVFFRKTGSVFPDMRHDGQQLKNSSNL